MDNLKQKIQAVKNNPELYILEIWQMLKEKQISPTEQEVLNEIRELTLFETLPLNPLIYFKLKS